MGQILRFIQTDDNPRLHRMAFLFFWIMSFGLAWWVLDYYEGVMYMQLFFTDFYGWVRDSPDTMWREGLVVGFLFATVITPIQAWLIWKRYGYLPKFWSLLTFIGMTVTGFAYPRIGLYDRGWGGINLAVNLFFWFLIFSIFQALALWQINRRSLYFIGLGFVSVASSLLLLKLRGFTEIETYWILMIGAIVQGVTTGLATLYLMSHASGDSIPKRKIGQQPNALANGKAIGIKAFVCLWVLSYFFHHVILMGTSEIWHFIIRYFLADVRFISTLNGKWYLGLVEYFCAGIGIAVAQIWLMKHYANRRIAGWGFFTIIGWAIAGMFSSSSYLELSRMGMLPYGLVFLIPAICQTIPLLRQWRWAWLWLLTGLLAAFVIINAKNNSFLLAGIVFSVSSALLFLWLNAKNRDIDEQSIRESL